MSYKRNGMHYVGVYLNEEAEMCLRKVMDYLQKQRPEQKITYSDAIRYVLYCDYKKQDE